jgi:alpha-N-arabinofuranosidase
MNRRAFLAASAGAVLAPRPARSATALITVLPEEKIGTLSPLVHGHFVEHLGGVVYDGIWVGENSKIPNIAGLRKQLIDDLRALKAPLFRWPGGCFADSYQWKDGVGPRAQRPRRSNFWIDSRELWKTADGPAKYDPNSFGTAEFLRFCKETGGAAYLAANVRSGTARDFYDWVEYCNAPAGTTTWGDLRGGAPANVQYWGIGNESWGCGGDFTGEEYSVEFRKFTSWVPRFGVPVRYIPAGPNGGDLEWTRSFFDALTRKSRGLINRVWGWALHYYSGTTGKGQAADFTEDDWYELLARASRMEGLIDRHWGVMGEYDRERRVKLVVDEWGTWHRAGSEVAPHHLFGQQATMRDAIVAGLTLDTFNRHADKIAMANIAQLINCLQSLFLAHEERYVKTANYHAFDLHKDHQNGQVVRTAFGSPGNPKGAPGVCGSASLKGKTLTLTCVNPAARDAAPAEIEISGARAASVKALGLWGAKLADCNTFAQPDVLKPRAVDARAGGGRLRLDLPPASVVRVTAELV